MVVMKVAKVVKVVKVAHILDSFGSLAKTQACARGRHRPRMLACSMEAIRPSEDGHSRQLTTPHCCAPGSGWGGSIPSGFSVSLER